MEKIKNTWRMIGQPKLEETAAALSRRGIPHSLAPIYDGDRSDPSFRIITANGVCADAVPACPRLLVVRKSCRCWSLRSAFVTTDPEAASLHAELVEDDIIVGGKKHG